MQQDTAHLAYPFPAAPQPGDVVAVAPGILWARIPLPFRLDHVNVYLLEDGVVRFEEDGRGRRTYRQVVQILTSQAAEQWGEKAIAYTTGRQRLTINWIRVLRPNGSVITDKPSHVQESIAPVAQEAPVYSDTRVRQFNLAGVAPNTIVDYSYTYEDTKPAVPGDFYSTWTMGAPCLPRLNALGSKWNMWTPAAG